MLVELVILAYAQEKRLNGHRVRRMQHGWYDSSLDPRSGGALGIHSYVLDELHNSTFLLWWQIVGLMRCNII